MDSFILALFKGDLRPFDNLAPNSPEYLALKEQLLKEKAYFKSVLSEDDYARLDKYEETSDNIAAMENAEAFSKGFQIAVKMMIEVYSDKSELPEIIKKMLGIDNSQK